MKWFKFEIVFDVFFVFKVVCVWFVLIEENINVVFGLFL